jgi:phospholipase/lecithinase/hemolysin
VIQKLLVFGDSLSDGGNARAALGDGAFPCPPHWNNRRCDGPLWVEHLAERLGLPPLLPSLLGGSNHAFGGARSGLGLTPKGLPNLLTQVEGFLAEERGPEPGGLETGQNTRGSRVMPPSDFADRHAMATAPSTLASDTLVVLRAGANDYLDGPPSPAVADAVNRHLLAAVNALADGGQRRFLVPSELPWGFCPIALTGVGEPERRAVNGLIARQNTALRVALEELAARRGLVVLQPDFHGLFLRIQAEPGAWGFRELSRPVLGAEGQGATALESNPSLAGSEGRRDGNGEHGVPDAQGFLWWDAWGHLTSAFHRALAERVVGELRRAGEMEGM